MGNICNPSSRRLGHSVFWLGDSIFTSGNYSTRIVRYNYQNYIYTIQHYCNWFFAEKHRQLFYMRYFLVYKAVQVAFLGHYPNQCIIYLVIGFYDFNIHVLDSIGVSWNSMQKQIKNNLSEIIQVHRGVEGVSDFLSSRNYRLLLQFIGRYFESISVVNKVLFGYVTSFFALVRQYKFLSTLKKIQNFYYDNINWRIKFNFIPISEVMDAHFLARYIERKLRTGANVVAVINQLIHLIQMMKNITGFKFSCSGRFKRGARKGYYWREHGQHSYGSFSNKYQLQYATATTVIKTGVCGIKVWLVIKSDLNEKNITQ